MAKSNPHRPFTPDPEQMARVPNVSGNAVNGLDEAEFRRPRMVYWAPDPSDIPHGEMQRWFYTVNPDEPEIVRQRAARQAILDAPLPDVAQDRIEQDSGAWKNQLSRFISEGWCERTSVAEMQSDWVYEGHEIPFSRVIIVGVAHAYDEISRAPDPVAAGEVMKQYTRAAGAAKEPAGRLRKLGWDAEPVTGPMTGALKLIPPALASGFGELGKHGSLINPELGSSFRLAAILTDAQFEPTPQLEHSIDGFCQSCRICEDACPPEALSPEKKLIRGETKWYVDFDRCLPYFNEHHGCAICIAVCPWSRPGVGLNLAAKLARRAERLAGE